MTLKNKPKDVKREKQRLRREKMGIGNYIDDALTTNRHVLESDEFKQLSGNAVKVLNYFITRYNGYNNGNFSAPLTQSLELFNLSDKSLQRALKELEEAQFIEKTRQGNKRACNLYALTFYAMDEIKGLAIKPTQAPSNKWRKSMQRLNAIFQKN